MVPGDFVVIHSIEATSIIAAAGSLTLRHLGGRLCDRIVGWLYSWWRWSLPAAVVSRVLGQEPKAGGKIVSNSPREKLPFTNGDPTEDRSEVADVIHRRRFDRGEEQ